MVRPEMFQKRFADMRFSVSRFFGGSYWTTVQSTPARFGRKVHSPEHPLWLQPHGYARGDTPLLPVPVASRDCSEISTPLNWTTVQLDHLQLSQLVFCPWEHVHYFI